MEIGDTLMTDSESAPFVDPRANRATLTMAYDGGSLGPIVYEKETVTIPARPEAVTTIRGLEWFVAEAWYWTSLVERRLSIPGGAPDYRHAVEPMIKKVETYIDPPGPTPPYWRVDSVTMDALIYTVQANPTVITLAYDQPETVTMGARQESQLMWQDWRNFVIAHQQFVHFCTDGNRNGYDIV